MEVSKCQKIIEFPKISIKMIDFKIFYESQTAICVKEIIKSHATKASYISGTKNFERRFTGIYRHSKCSKNAVPGPRKMVECKCFFLTPTRNIFWLCCSSILFIMLSELRFVKLVIFFASFCWL